MPEGKPAATPCIQLDDRGFCSIFGRLDRPRVCVALAPSAEMRGFSRKEAFAYISALERKSAPSPFGHTAL